MNHVRTLCARSDIEIGCVCDVDSERLGNAAEHVETTMVRRPRAVNNMREVFDDDRIDAVFIATPDHWHAPAAILALDAGKHVYVEKPCCHNIREGRLMADAWIERIDDQGRFPEPPEVIERWERQMQQNYDERLDRLRSAESE